MADVFVSYSRKDTAFAKRLVNSLARTQRDVWIDWEDIPRAADWLNEIYAGIQSADTFLLIVSQHSLASEICNDEIRHALEHNKRIIPLIYQEITNELERSIAGGHWYGQSWEKTARDNWIAVKHLNWIFFTDEARFDEEFQALIQTLEQDIEHIKLHTRLLVRAKEWETGARSPSYLLKGDEITQAEKWLAAGESKSPCPTDLHKTYIQASRQDENARQKRLRRLRRATWIAGTVGVLAVIATVASVIIGTRSVSEAEARRNRLMQESESVRLTNQAQQIVGRDPNIALALASEAVNIVDPPALAQHTFAALAYPAPRRWVSSQSSVASLVFSPDKSKALLVDSCSVGFPNPCMSKALILLDIQSGNELHNFSGYNNRVKKVAFSPDGTTALSSAENGELILWDVASGTMKQALTVPDTGVTSLAFSPDGTRALFGCANGRVILWDLVAGQLLNDFPNGVYAVTSIAFSPDGNMALFSGSDDSSVKLRNLTTGEELRGSFGEYAADVTNLAFSPDGTKALSGSCTARDKYERCATGEIILWDVAAGMFQQYLGATSSEIMSLAFSPDGTRALSGSLDGTVILWNVEDRRIVHSYRMFGRYVSFSSDGQMGLAGQANGSIMTWDLESGEVLRTFKYYAGSILDVAISPDGKWAITVNDLGSLELWDVATGEHLRQFSTGDYYYDLVSVAFGPDGKTALSGSCVEQGDFGCITGGMILWDVATGAPLRTFTGHGDEVTSVAFSPGGKTALSGSRDTTLTLWDVATGAPLRTFTGHGDEVTSVAFSPDGKTALSGSCVEQGDFGCITGGMILWDVATGAPLRTFTGHSDEVTSVAFSPDGKTALSGSRDTTLTLWDVATGAPLRTFTGHSDEVTSVAFSPDGKTALSGSCAAHTIDNECDTGEIILWDMATGAPLRTFTGHNDEVKSVAFTPDGKAALSGSCGEIVRLRECDLSEMILWRIDTLEELKTWTRENRYLHPFTCRERLMYQIQPVPERCEAD